MRILTLSILLIFKLTNLNGQQIAEKKQVFPISITLLHESLSVPILSSPITSRLNPAIMVGTDYFFKKTEKHDFYVAPNLGYYYHKNWESTLFTEFRFGYRRHLNRFSISPSLGFGASYNFIPKAIYKFESGQFQEVSSKGNLSFQSSFTLTPSFKLSQKINSPELSINYTFTIQFPFSTTKGFHQFIGFGYKFYPFTKK